MRQTYAGPIEVSLYDDGSEVRPFPSTGPQELVQHRSLALCVDLVANHPRCDATKDGSPAIIQRWLPVFAEAGFTTQLRRNDRSTGRGCGFAKNRSDLTLVTLFPLHTWTEGAATN